MKSMWANWVLDVTHGHEPMAFCPIEDDGTIITGVTMISGKCPGRLVGVVHFDGDGAVIEWLAKHSNVVDELVAANGATTNHDDATDSRSVIARTEQGGGLSQSLKRAAMEEQAEAWRAVCALLSELRPGWANSSKRGMDSALDAIRALYLHPATVTDEDVERITDVFLAHTGQAHKVTQLQRDLARPCMRAALESFANKEWE